MSEEFDNGLTKGESERLDMLAEEAAEIIQAISKIKRHGKYSTHPDKLDYTNLQHLIDEIVDFLSVSFYMESQYDFGDILILYDEDKIRNIINKKLKYTHFQEIKQL